MLAQNLGGPMERIVMPGAQHEQIGAFFKSQALVGFPPPLPPTFRLFDSSPPRCFGTSVPKPSPR